MTVVGAGPVSGIEVVHYTTASSLGVYLDTYALVCVLCGQVALRYRRAANVAQAGDLILLESGRTVVVNTAQHPQTSAVAVFVEASVLESIGAAACAPVQSLCFDDAIVRGDVARSFCDAARRVTAPAHVDVREAANLVEAIREVIRAYGRAAHEQELLSASTQQPRPTIARAVHQAASYLHTHVADSVPLDALARTVCMSKYHLTRMFHRFYGLPPHAYQLQLRLAYAKRLIAKGLSVAAAARTAGFAGPVHLHRHFRVRYGVAPGHYAPAHRESHITLASLRELSRLPLRV